MYTAMFLARLSTLQLQGGGKTICVLFYIYHSFLITTYFPILFFLPIINFILFVSSFLSLSFACQFQFATSGFGDMSAGIASVNQNTFHLLFVFHLFVRICGLFFFIMFLLMLP